MEIKNQINDLLSEFDQHNRIVSIGLQGGFARGTAIQKTSDIDLIFVFEKSEDAKDILKGSFDYRGSKFEARHLYLDKVNPNLWEPKIRYVYSDETLILRDNNKMLQNIIEMSKMTFDQQQEITVYAIRKFGTRGITYKNVLYASWRGFYWGDPKDYWVVKGDLISAHLRLDECVTLLCSLIFALNLKFLPSSKWRYSIMQNLNWLPNNFIFLLEQALTRSKFDMESFSRREKAFQTLLEICIEKADIEKILPNNIGDFYKNKIQDFTDNTSDSRKIKIWK